MIISVHKLLFEMEVKELSVSFVFMLDHHQRRLGCVNI